MRKYLILLIIISVISCQNEITKEKEIIYTNYIDIVRDNYFTNFFTNYERLYYTNYFTNNLINVYEYKINLNSRTNYEYLYKINELYYTFQTNKKLNNYFENVNLKLEKYSKYEIIYNNSKIKRTHPSGLYQFYDRVY